MNKQQEIQRLYDNIVDIEEEIEIMRGEIRALLKERLAAKARILEQMADDEEIIVRHGDDEGSATLVRKPYRFAIDRNEPSELRITRSKREKGRLTFGDNVEQDGHKISRRK